jgi:hypothetical protein
LQTSQALAMLLSARYRDSSGLEPSLPHLSSLVAEFLFRMALFASRITSAFPRPRGFDEAADWRCARRGNRRRTGLTAERNPPGRERRHPGCPIWCPLPDSWDASHLSLLYSRANPVAPFWVEMGVRTGASVSHTGCHGVSYTKANRQTERACTPAWPLRKEGAHFSD